MLRHLGIRLPFGDGRHYALDMRSATPLASRPASLLTVIVVSEAADWRTKERASEYSELFSPEHCTSSRGTHFVWTIEQNVRGATARASDRQTDRQTPKQVELAGFELANRKQLILMGATKSSLQNNSRRGVASTLILRDR